MQHDLAERRRWYAQDLRLRAPVRRHTAIAEAFAAVPRERFLGPGPWRLLPDRHPDNGLMTPDDDPGWLYHDVLVTIDQTRGLYNGLPSLWARSFDHVDWRRQKRVMQVGSGTGYYAAVLAEIVGPNGRVIAVECDDDLAAKARDNLRPWAQVEVVHGDGRTHDPRRGRRHHRFRRLDPPRSHLARSPDPGGELLMPLTGENWFGFLLRVTRCRDHDASLIVLPAARDENRFDAEAVGGVGIFPCSGGRDEKAAKRLQDALAEPRAGSWHSAVPIEALHRGEPGPEAMDKVWYCGPDFWLERRRPE
jgi:protein-L-isoaspartate(D-aspartate) O-methyltransferase